MININHEEVFLLVILLTLNLQLSVNADDIKDFELEGISLYESALNHFSYIGLWWFWLCVI